MLTARILGLFVVAIALGLLGWWAIVALLGPWLALLIAALGLFGYVYLVANAFGRWRP